MAQSASHADDALLLDAALESIPYGFCVWSGAFRLVMWNRHYLDIYGFPPSRIRKGMRLDAVVKLSSELGNHPGQSPGEFVKAYKTELTTTAAVTAPRCASRQPGAARSRPLTSIRRAWAGS